MADTLSWEQVSGQVAAKPGATVTPARTLSWEEVSGLTPTQTAERAEASTLWGRARTAAAPYVDLDAAAKVVKNNTVGMGMQIGDMIAGLPAMVGRTMAFPTITAVFSAMGADPKLAATASKMLLQEKIPEAVAAPYRKIAERLGETEAYENNPVAYVMKWLGEKIEHGAAATEKRTSIPSEWTEYGAEALMSWLGLRGVRASIRSHDNFYANKRLNKQVVDRASAGRAGDAAAAQVLRDSANKPTRGDFEAAQYRERLVGEEGKATIDALTGEGPIGPATIRGRTPERVAPAAMAAVDKGYLDAIVGKEGKTPAVRLSPDEAKVRGAETAIAESRARIDRAGGSCSGGKCCASRGGEGGAGSCAGSG